jgi:predicted HTH transcriptional regulator
LRTIILFYFIVPLAASFGPRSGPDTYHDRIIISNSMIGVTNAECPVGNVSHSKRWKISRILIRLEIGVWAGFFGGQGSGISYMEGD